MSDACIPTFVKERYSNKFYSLNSNRSFAPLWQNPKSGRARKLTTDDKFLFLPSLNFFFKNFTEYQDIFSKQNHKNVFHLSITVCFKVSFDRATFAKFCVTKSVTNSSVSFVEWEWSKENLSLWFSPLPVRKNGRLCRIFDACAVRKRRHCCIAHSYQVTFH